MEEKVLFSANQINEKVKEVAKEIDNYISTLDDKDNIIFIGLLTGCIHFVSDLTRNINSDHKLAFVKAKSYINNSRGDLTIDQNIQSVKNSHVIILDDICDSGITLNSIIAKLKLDNPLSIKTCVLLNKLVKNKEHTPDFKAFDIEDYFVYGYGLDYDEFKRNLKDIRILV